MKRIQVRAWVILITCSCGSIAQDKVPSPNTSDKSVPVSLSGKENDRKLTAKKKVIDRHNAFLEKQKVKQEEREKTESHLNQIRQAWDKQAEKERVDSKKKEESGRTPAGEGISKKDSIGAKK